MKEEILIPVTTSHNLHTNKQQNFKRVYLLLHGYLLDGEFMFNKLKESLPQDALILAPNAPFLVPQKKADEYLPKYAWYFFEPTKKTFYINYRPAAEYLKDILKKYNPENKPVTLIGYSQGGYLSPKVAEIVEEVDAVIGLACVFRNQKFNFRPNVTFHQIHGNIDVAVEMSGALEEWAILKERGNQGEFIELADVGHRLTQEFITALSDLI